MVQLRPNVPFPQQQRYKSTFNADLENLLSNAVRLRSAYRDMEERRKEKERQLTIANEIEQGEKTLEAQMAARDDLAGMSRANATQKLFEQIAEEQAKQTGSVNPQLESLIRYMAQSGQPVSGLGDLYGQPGGERGLGGPETGGLLGPPDLQARGMLPMSPLYGRMQGIQMLPPSEREYYRQPGVRPFIPQEAGPEEAVRRQRERTEDREKRGEVPSHLQHLVNTPEKQAQYKKHLEYRQRIKAAPDGAREDAPVRQSNLDAEGALASVFRTEPIGTTLERANRFVFRPIGAIVGAAILELPAHLLPHGSDFKGFEIAGRTIVAPKGTSANAMRSAIDALMTENGIDLDAAISAFHDEFNAVPGFWGAVEAVATMGLPPYAIGPLGKVGPVPGLNKGQWAKPILKGKLKGAEYWGNIPKQALLKPDGTVRHTIERQAFKAAVTTREISTARMYRGLPPTRITSIGKTLGNIEAEIAEKGVPEWARWKGKAIAPYSRDWVELYKARPDLAETMDDYVFRLENGIPTSGAGHRLPSGSPFAAAVDAINTPHSKLAMNLADSQIVKFRDDVIRKWREALTDRFAGIESLEKTVRHHWRKTYGQELPDELAGSMMASLVPGAPSAAIHRVRDTINMAKSVLKTNNVDPKHLEAYLFAVHHKEVVKMHGSGRKLKISSEQVPFKGDAKLTGMEPADNIINQMTGTLGPSKMATLKEAAKVVTDHYAEMLRMEVRGGRISESSATRLREAYPNYNPIGYQDMETSVAFLGGPRRLSRSEWAEAMEQLGHRGLQNERRGLFDMLHSASIKSSSNIARNNAARSIIRMAQVVPNMVKKIPNAIADQPATKGLGKIQVREGGDLVTYEVPKWLADEASLLEIKGYDIVANIGRIANAPFKAVLTQYNPSFMAANMMVDTMTVWTMRGVSPWRVTTSLLANMKNIVREDAIYRRMIDAGGDVSGWHGKDPRLLIKAEERAGNIVIRNIPDWIRWMRHAKFPLTALSNLGHAMEMAPRRAVFRKSVEKGNSDYIAALNARRSTVDFDRAGSAIKMANNFFLYLNPAVQGIMLPYRAARENPLQAAIGAMGLAGAALGIYANNRRYAEYYDIPREVRFQGMIFMLPSTEVDEHGNTVPHYIRIVPNLRELNMFFATANYLAERLDGENQQDFGEFLTTTGMDIMSPVQDVSTLMLPTEAIHLGTELFNNKNYYTGRPIIPPDMEHLPVEEQYNEYTSLTARRLGQFLHVSPMEIDHILEQGAFTDILLGADMGIKQTMEGIDPEVESIVAFLRNVGETTPVDYIPIHRRVILNELSPELREKVLEAEKAPEPKIPFVSSIKNRFYGERGGEIWASGLRKALKSRDLNMDDYYEMTRQVSMIGDEVDQLQYQAEEWIQDGYTEDNNGNRRAYGGKEYRETLRTQQAFWQANSIHMGLTMPNFEDFVTDPAIRAEFYNDIYTLSGDMPDSRTKSALLYATFKSIPIPPLEGSPPELGEQDWRKYNAMVDEFRGELSEEDSRFLELEIQSRMTPFHRDNYYLPMQEFKWYWHLEDKYLDTPAKRAVYDDYVQEVKSQSIDMREAYFLQYPDRVWVEAVDEMVQADRDTARSANINGLEEFLYRWDFIASPINSDVKRRMTEINPANMMRLVLSGERGQQ